MSLLSNYTKVWAQEKPWLTFTQILLNLYFPLFMKDFFPETMAQSYKTFRRLFRRLAPLTLLS
jgi:hypothetical protein